MPPCLRFKNIVAFDDKDEFKLLIFVQATSDNSIKSVRVGIADMDPSKPFRLSSTPSQRSALRILETGGALGVN